jgi:PKD repeat protein
MDTSGTSWEEATCSGYQIQRFPDENLIYVPIDQAGIFVFSEEHPASASAPEAQFSASPTIGLVPLPVAFTDQSSNSPTGWLWDFGDGSTSTEQHPVHVYCTAGTYDVALTVSNASGSDTETVSGYITVKARIYMPVVLRDAH